MKPSIALDRHRAEVRSIISAHRVLNPRLFGSTSRGQDSAESDLDLLVDPTERTSLFDIAAIRQDLLALLGVPVDVVTPGALPESIRQRVLAEAIPL